MAIEDMGLPSLEIPAIARLATFPQWVLWRVEVRGGNPTKVPLTVSGYPASVTKPVDWTTFERICQAFVTNSEAAGIGFVLTPEDPIVFIDLDHVIHPDGSVSPWAVAVVEELSSYTEVSPSGTGLHVICEGRLESLWNQRQMPGEGNQKLEMYARGRYMTMTGARFQGLDFPHGDIEQRQGAIDVLQARFGKGERVYGALGGRIDPILDPDASAPTEKFNALTLNHTLFARTWGHRRSDLADQSLSSYDLALASIAAHAGWEDNEIAGLLIAHRRERGGLEKVLRPSTAGSPGYLARTLARARQGITGSKGDLETMRGPEDRQKALDHASRILGCPIHGVRQYGTTAPIYSLMAGDPPVEVTVGSATEIRSQGAVGAQLVIACRHSIPPIKGPVWSDLVTGLLAHLEHFEVDESEPATQLQGWIQGYLEDHPLQDQEEALGHSEPFLEDGRTWISAAELAKWAYLNRSERITGRALAIRLRQQGGVEKGVFHRKDRHRFHRRYWGLETPDE